MVQSIPASLIAKFDQRALAERRVADSLRKLALFDEEIRDALARFYADGGVLEPGGQSGDKDSAG